MPLVLTAGQTVRIGEKTWTLDADAGLRIRVEAGVEVDCGAWSIRCEGAWWDFLWPLGISNAYKPLFPDEVAAMAEVTLWTKATTGAPRPTAAFVLTVHP